MKIAIFIPSYGDGGVERMLVNMARGLTASGLCVRFFTGNMHGPHLNKLPDEVELLHFPPVVRHRQIAALQHELQQRPVDWLLAAKLPDAEVAVAVKKLLTDKPRVLLRPGTAVTERLRKRFWWQRWTKLARLRRTYPQADAIVANSEGVRADIALATGLSANRIELIRNPVIVPEFYTMAAEPLDEEWFEPGAPPVVLGVGGLRRQKGFDVLLDAFAQVRRQRECRLMILGDGGLRSRLEEQVRSLGVAENVRFTGFVDNPYPYMVRAATFVLSSRWEGSPNVLTEALALGVPVVATDCKSGPREILAGGAVAPLVPVDDPDALASAMLQVLAEPPDASGLVQAARPYTMEANAAAYANLLHSRI